MANSICDADLIVKISKEDYIDVFFNKYKIVNFSDAVCQEIERCKTSNNISKLKKEYFSKADENIKKYIKTDVAEKIIFSKLDEIDKVLIRKDFYTNNIEFDEISEKFELGPDLGETVTVIYADVLGINLILADDTKCRHLIERKPEVLRFLASQVRQSRQQFGQG